MKTFRRTLVLSFLSLSVGLVTLLGKASAPDSLALTPSTITNDYTGALDLTITGLDSAGQTVVVEEFFDGDDSSTINAGDVLLRQFNVVDGQVTSIGGQRNINVAGDEDGAANTAILTRLFYSASEIVGRIDGRHIFRISPSGAGFSPFTANLIVTQRDYAGSGISGTVVGGMPAVGQPGALVALLGAGNDGDFVAMTVTGASGNFSLKVAPGSYLLLPAKSGFVFNEGAAVPINVGAGSFVTGQTLTLSASGRTISGRVRDGVSLAGVPAIPLMGQSDTGFFSLTLADAAGNFVMDASAEPWGMGLDERGLARLGFLSFETAEGSAGNVTGFNLDLPRATALIYGSVKTPANVSVPFIDLEADTNGLPRYKSAGISDGNGNYAVGAAPGSWRVSPNAAGFLGRDASAVVNTNGSAVLRNLTAYPITAHIRGVVRDNNNNLVPFLSLLARDPSATSGNDLSSRSNADANGAFDLGVFGGGGTATQAWQLQINENGGPQQFVSTGPIFHVQDGVDINGVTYLVYVVTAHLRGQVLDENNAPIGNVGISAGSGMNGELLSGTNTDAGGNFDVGVFAGTWNLGLSNIEGLGLIPQNFSTVVSDGVDQNGLIFRARHTTATISGTVRSASNMPIAGVTVLSNSTSGGATYNANALTDASGNYSLPVFSSTWAVGVSSNQLIARGFSPVANQSVFVDMGTVAVNFVAGPLATAVSRKFHGATPFEINLPLTGALGIECRSGGAGNNYQIVVTFGGPVTLNNASLSTGTGSVSGTSGSGTGTITANLTGVTSGQRVTLFLAGVNDGVNIFDLSVPMGVLVGDTTNNGAVSASDISQVKGQSGQTVTASNFRTDVTANGGNVTASDIGLVKSVSGSQLPP